MHAEIGEVVERLRSARSLPWLRVMDDAAFYGDGWEHEVRIEQRMLSIVSDTPQLTGGARACPCDRHTRQRRASR